MTDVPGTVEVLFVCSRNEIRSLTAERMLDGMPGFQARSAGTETNARVRVTAGHLGWADIIFVMEKRHRDRLAQFGDVLAGKKVVCLDLPDEYRYRDDALIDALQSELCGHIASTGVGEHRMDRDASERL